MEAPRRKLKAEELGRLSPEDYSMVEKAPLLVVLDSIRSKNNVGAVFRSADAFRIEKIFLCGYTPAPPDRDISKTSLGAESTVEWESVREIEPLIKSLKADGYLILAVEQTEGSILLPEFKVDPDQKYAVVMGNEVGGVDQAVIDLSDDVLEIPQFGTKHSLNVSVAAGILLYALSNQLRGKKQS